MAMRVAVVLVTVLAVCVLLASHADGKKKGKKKRMNAIVKDLEGNVTALWSEVKQLSQPVHVHLHGDGHVMHPHHEEMSSSSSDDDHDHQVNDDDHHHDDHDQGVRDGRRMMSHGHHGDKMKKMMMSKKMRGGDDGEEEEPWGEGHVHREASGTHVHIHLHTGEEGEGGRGAHQRHHQLPQEYRYARCDMAANSALPARDRQNIRGSVFFRQMPGQPIEARAVLHGFELNHEVEGGPDHRHLRGLHGHEFGDLSDGCNSLGGHINPYGVDHGGPQAEHRHLGDFGNIEVQEDGRAQRTFTDDVASLFGPGSMLGRSMVIHAGPDDHGKGHSAASKKSGNAGGRIACCVVIACPPPRDVWP